MPDDNLLPQKGSAYLFPNYFDSEKSNTFFDLLLKQTPWRHDAISIYGRRMLQPRLTAWYGEPGRSYRYSGLTLEPLVWTDTLIEIKRQIEVIAQVNFTGALLNYYRNQDDSMGWHRDNEKELGKNPIIGSVSFGASREFQFRFYQDKKTRISVELQHGSLLLMKGETQDYWEHSLPKRKRTIGPRINITFRVVL